MDLQRSNTIPGKQERNHVSEQGPKERMVIPTQPWAVQGSAFPKRLLEERDRLLQEYHACKKENQSLNEDRARLHRDYHICKKDNHLLKEITNSLHDEVGQLKEVLAKIQLVFLQQMGPGGWIPRDDTYLRDRILDLRGSIKTWARKYAVESLSDLKFSPDQEQELRHSISRIARLNSLPLSTPNVVSFIKASKIRPSDWVTAVISDKIHYEIFENTFSCLDELPLSATFGRASQILRKVYSEMVKVNPREAHSWRSQMFRILTPHMLDMIGRRVGSEKLREHVDWSLELSKFFLRELAGPKEFDEMVKHLMPIWETAIELSAKLWTRRPNFDCSGMDQLRDQPFTIASPIMEAHWRHRLDEGDPSLDGKAVIVVVHPAVLKYGNEEGENYDQSLVLAKALVLLED